MPCFLPPLTNVFHTRSSGLVLCVACLEQMNTTVLLPAPFHAMMFPSHPAPPCSCPAPSAMVLERFPDPACCGLEFFCSSCSDTRLCD